MLDFIKSLNISDELKTNEIYNLFKTDSSDLNLKFLSILQKFHSTNEFLNCYAQQNCENIFEFYNNLKLLSSKIYEETEAKLFNSQIDKYISDISKIILLFSLIQKNNELLNHLLIITKKILKKFYRRNKSKSIIKEKINNCINDLMAHSQITSQRNYSRRSTKENTITTPIVFNGFNLGKSKQFDTNTNEDEQYLFFQCNTPKFEEEEDNEIVEVNEEQSICNNININNEEDINNNEDINNDEEHILYNIKGDSKKTIGSSFTLKHMNFIYDSDEMNTRPIKKNKTFKLGINNNFNPKNFFKKKSISNKINDSHQLTEDFDFETNQSEKILAKFLSTINGLFKNGKINSEEKISIKQLIISDTQSIIEKFKEYNISNDYVKIDSKCIKIFLMEQIKNMKLNNNI